MSELWINFAHDGNPNGAFNGSYVVDESHDAVTQTLGTVNVTGLRGHSGRRMIRMKGD